MQGVFRSSKAFPRWIPPSFFATQLDAGDRWLWRLWSHILPSFPVRTLARPLFRLAVRQNVFCETLGGFALNIGESGHTHASLLDLLNDGILIGHLLAQYHCRASFGFVAFCAVCAEYIFSRGIRGWGVRICFRTAHQAGQCGKRQYQSCLLHFCS